MKDVLKSGSFKVALGSVVLFSFGIFFGFQLNNHSLAAIQGYLFDSDEYATDSNATDSNATDANATDANATDCNAWNTDYIIYLDDFFLENKKVNTGDKLYFYLETSGADIVSASVTLKNKKTNKTFTAELKDVYGRPNIDIPSNAQTSDYVVETLLLVGLNSDYSTFTKLFSEEEDEYNSYYYDFSDCTVAIQGKESTKITLKNMSLKSSETKINEKVYVNYETSEVPVEMMLTFVNKNSEKMTVNVKSVEKDPYFIVPTTSKAGTYELKSATILSDSNTYTYTKDGSNQTEKFNFNSTLIINSSEKENEYVYNNEDLNEDILKKIFNSSSDSTINIDVSNNPIVNSELFNSVKGTSKNLILNYNDNEYVVNGNDISTPKTINVSLSTKIIDSSSEIGKLVNNGIELDFPSNGDLPGDTLVRVKITQTMKQKLGDNKVQVYYYNSECNNFTKIASDVVASNDGYYEFNIKHNSKYIMVTNELDKSIVTEETDKTVTFQKGTKTNLLLIGLGILVIIVVALVIIVIKRNRKNKELY